MRKMILFVLLVSFLNSTRALAQEETKTDTDSGEPRVTSESPKKTVTSVASWAVTLSSLQWNEALVLKQAGKSETDVANYSGISVGVQKEITHYRWGWNFGAFIGTGRANGGGNSGIVYQKDNQSFTVIGISPRAFYRVTGSVNVGVTALGYLRNIDWPTDTPGLTVDATRNFTLTALADLNLRLSDRFDFYQGIGPLDKGATFWKIGLGYRF